MTSKEQRVWKLILHEDNTRKITVRILKHGLSNILSSNITNANKIFTVSLSALYKRIGLQHHYTGNIQEELDNVASRQQSCAPKFIIIVRKLSF